MEDYLHWTNKSLALDQYTVLSGYMHEHQSSLNRIHVTNRTSAQNFSLISLNGFKQLQTIIVSASISGCLLILHKLCDTA